MPRILRRIGYCGVFISNTLIVGVLLMVFATIGLRTRVWTIVLLLALADDYGTAVKQSRGKLVR
jgi:hypothetical protein